MGMLEKFIARQAADLIEKTEPSGDEPTWTVDFDIAVKGASVDTDHVGYQAEVQAPDFETAAYLALLEIAPLMVKEADQRAVMRRTAEQIQAKFAAGEGQ